MLLNDFMSLIYPRTCIHCHETLLHNENYLCTVCRLNLPVTDDHVNKENDLFKKFAFEPKIKSASSFLYLISEGVTQKLLYQLKYRGSKEIGEYLGRLYAKKLGDEIATIDLIVPVPIHNTKLRKRGYNQSTYLAKGLAEVLDIELKENLVQRIVKTTSQTKKSKVARWQNVMNIYSQVQDGVKGKNVLIVDDVITTGATVGMLCERFAEAGVNSIHLMCLARGK